MACSAKISNGLIAGARIITLSPLINLTKKGVPSSTFNSSRIAFGRVTRPYCASKNPKASAVNCVATRLPHLLPFWDYNRNGDVTPWNTCHQSHKKVWWICPDNSEHRYLASVQLRSKGFGKCPICKKEKRGQRKNKKRKGKE